MTVGQDFCKFCNRDQAGFGDEGRSNRQVQLKRRRDAPQKMGVNQATRGLRDNFVILIFSSMEM